MKRFVTQAALVAIGVLFTTQIIEAATGNPSVLDFVKPTAAYSHTQVVATPVSVAGSVTANPSSAPALSKASPEPLASSGTLPGNVLYGGILASLASLLTSMNAYLDSAGASRAPPQNVAGNGNPQAYGAGTAVDQLSNTAISNPTITGGSISGTSIIGTIGNVIDTALATIDDLTSNTVTATNVTFTNSTTTNASITDLAATNATTTNLYASATSTLAAVILTNDNCSSYGNGGKLTTDAFGDVICAADQGGSGSTVGGADTQVQFNSGGSFAASASFTYATSTNTLAVPNASIGAATTTQLFAATASTTYLSAQTASLGSLTLESALPVSSGGTGIANPAAGILLGSYGGSGWQQLATSSLGLLTTNVAEGSNLYFTTARVASVIAGTTTDALAQGATNKYFSNALAQGAISISGAPLTYSSGVIGINQANGSQAGYLSSIDWSAFNGKVSSTSLSAGAGIGYNSATGVISNAGVTNLAASYPLLTAGGTGSLTLSLGFGTTTNNTFSGSNVFNGNTTLANATSTNLSVSGNSVLGSATTTSLFSAIADFTNGIIGTLNASVANIVGFTATNATTTNLIATNATTTNLAVTGIGYFAGNVGIGTTTPQSSLDVHGAIRSDNNYATLELVQGDDATGFRWTLGDNGTLLLQKTTNNFTSGSNPLFIDASNDVGLSSTTPATTLSVAGSGYLTGGLGVGLLNTTAGTLQTSGAATIGGPLIASGTFIASADLGSTGLNIEPYGDEAASNYTETTGIGTHAYIAVANGFFDNFPGSGTFGPADADVATQISAQKTNYLTSATDGEVDSLEISSRQGEKGDTGGVTVDAEKTRTGTGADSGGVAGAEIESDFLNASGTPTQDMHVIAGFGEGAGGVSGGTGYGYYSEARLADIYSAYHVDTLNEYNGAPGSYGWQYAFDATHDRSSADEYFRIRGDATSSNQVPGDIIQGMSGESKIIRTTDSGTLEIRNDADTQTLFSVTNNGNVGIGSTTPYSRLEVLGPDTASTSAFAVVNSASTTEFTVYDTGNAVLAGSLVQNSDERLKTNIQNLDGSSSLVEINALNPVTFNWIDPAKSSVPQFGFIAQQVQSVFPDLVSTTSPTALTPDGTLSLNYIDLISPIVAAIQELDRELTSLASTVAGFAQSITTHLVTADDITANNQLCIGQTCVTETQLQALLASANQSASESASPSSSTTDATDTPPVIAISGDNPAIIQVGASYTDLGATVTGPQTDLNLGIQTFLNGVLASNIVIDTSSAATDTIDYVATDSQGLTSTSTRTVIVEPAVDPTTPPPPATSGDASSTTATSSHGG